MPVPSLWPAAALGCCLAAGVWPAVLPRPTWLRRPCCRSGHGTVASSRCARPACAPALQQQAATQPRSHAATQPRSHAATQPRSHAATQPARHGRLRTPAPAQPQALPPALLPKRWFRRCCLLPTAAACTAALLQAQSVLLELVQLVDMDPGFQQELVEAGALGAMARCAAGLGRASEEEEQCRAGLVDALQSLCYECHLGGAWQAGGGRGARRAALPTCSPRLSSAPGRAAPSSARGRSRHLARVPRTRRAHGADGGVQGHAQRDAAAGGAAAERLRQGPAGARQAGAPAAVPGHLGSGEPALLCPACRAAPRALRACQLLRGASGGAAPLLPQ